MSRTVTDLALMLGAFAAAAAISAVLGAPNLGQALTYGELAFTAALMWVLLARA